MKKTINFILLFSLPLFLITSCSKDNLSEVKDVQFSKEQLSEMLTTYSDEKINRLPIDIELEVKSVFSSIEIEKMLLQRAVNVAQNGSEENLKKAFNEFRKKYNESILDSSKERQNSFAAECLKDIETQSRSKRIVLDCDFPNLGCTDLNDCTEEDDFVFYTQHSRAEEDIVLYDCNRQQNTTDCDHSYAWNSTLEEYSSPNQFRFVWWCANTTYRFLMDDNISGFRRDDATGFSSFLGNHHEYVMGLVWALDECPNDRFINVTEFDAFRRTSTEPVALF